MPIVHNLFSFEGRMRRRDFWISMLIILVASWILRAIIGLAFGPMYYAGAAGGVPMMQMAAMSGMWTGLGIVWLILLWPWLAVAVKRAHDRGKSGIWVLLAFIPILGWLWCLIDLGILEGTPGPNEYGPSPKDLGSASGIPA